MICIDVSGEHIEVVFAKGSQKSLLVENSMTLKVPPELFSGSGNINMSVLADSLRETLERSSDKKVIISFSFLPTVYSLLTLHRERNRNQQRMAVESQVFANISPDSYYVDYFAVPNSTTKDNKQDFVSYAMPKKVVDGAFEMLKKMGKNPVAFVPSQHAAQCFITGYFPNKTISLAKMSEKSVTLHLFNPPDNMITRSITVEEGESNALDILSGIGGGVSPEQIFVQNVEKLNSYQSIKFPGSPIEQVLVFGQNATDELVSLVSNNVGLPCSLLASRHKIFASCAPVYTLGAMMSLGSTEINFFTARGNEKVAKNSKQLNVPLLVALIVLLVNIVIVFGVMSIEMQMASSVEQKEAELNSGETLALLEQYGTLREDFVGLVKSNSAFDALSKELTNQGEFDRDILDRTVSSAPDEVDVISFSYGDNSYNFICTGTTEQQAADYVEILTETGVFDVVGYFGFSEGVEGVSFTVTGSIIPNDSEIE